MKAGPVLVSVMAVCGTKGGQGNACNQTVCILDTRQQEHSCGHPKKTDCKFVHQSGNSTYSTAIQGDIFQQDDARPHSAVVTERVIESVDMLLWPAKSPDLSPIEHTLNPVWDEEFVFEVRPSQTLKIEVFDENRLTRDDFLGLVELPLRNIPTERPGRIINAKYYILRPRSTKSRVKGHLEIYHAYTSAGTSEDDDTTSQQETEAGWEMVNAEEGGSALEESSASPVSVATPPSNHSPLPPGWEERQDANGRTYYVNHAARTTQWERPTGATQVVEEAQQRSLESAQEFRRRVHISVDNTDDSLPDHQPRDNVEILRTMLETQRLDPNIRRHSMPTASLSRQSSSNQSTSEGLPAGWSMQVAPNGRVFYIDHNSKTTTWVDPRTGKPSVLPNQSNVPNRPRFSSVDDLGPLPEGWEERFHTDGRIFFIDHNSRITQWEDPRLNNPNIAGPAVPYSRDYKRKYEYLKAKLPKPANVSGKFELKVSRANILEDCYRIISAVTRVDMLRTKLWVEFDGEEVLDYGGASRELFFLLSKEMFNPYYGLFEYSAVLRADFNELGTSISETARLVGCSQSTVVGTHAKWMNDGETSSRRLGVGRLRAIKEKSHWRLSRMVKQNWSHTVAQLTAQYNARPSRIVLEHTVQRSLLDMELCS
ncbi:e3 ubiquitin-protein ligase NEDD4 [Trichonephila clavipes]|nr:e3 ubiquitin-protein ligase NEDD4 [Trichonephila clavipes]